MNMQHNTWCGTPIGKGRDSDQGRTIKLDRLAAEANRTVSGRVWYAARVWTGRELSVQKALAELDIETSIPMRMGPELRRRGRVIPSQPMPAIHGYVIVRMPPDGAVLAALTAIEHFIEIVGGYENPMPIPNEDVKRFKALADEGLYDWDREVERRFKVGDKASIVGGLFYGASCEIISCRDDGLGDAVVLVSLLGKTVPMTVPLAILEES